MSDTKNCLDVLENDILAISEKLMSLLLKDHTTQENIFWATDDYAALGKGYSFYDPIRIEQITGENGNVIMPRVAKSKLLQASRSKDMAEVFTPSWLCNQMLNDVDERLFGRKNVFNICDEKGKVWQPTTNPVFKETDPLTWKEYVTKTVMEITCGEAPFIVSRYDTVSGRFFDNVNQRIGFLDRKLRVVTENVKEKNDWIHWVKIAYKCSFGYEWQGDNLLLARQNLLMTFFDYYETVWNEQPSWELVAEMAEIISWNIWQMDGLKYVLPKSCKTKVIEESDIFGETTRKEIPCEGCLKDLKHKHNGIYAKMMNWSKNEVVDAITFLNQKDNDK